jgi:L-malate glycosyltransferase
MIKVTHIIGTLDFGGAERLLLDICRKIDRKIFDIDVIVLKKDNNRLIKSFEEAGIGVRLFDKRSKLDVKIVDRVASYLKQTKPDIVHTHLFTADFWGAMAARQAGVKKIVSTRHALLSEGRVRDSLGAKSRRKMDKVIAISNATKEFMIKKEKIEIEKIKLIYNGIDMNRFFVQDSKLFNNEDFVVGSIGRLSREKGHKHLVRACRFINDKRWSLNIVGDGPMKKELKMLVRLLDIEDKVKFIGSVLDIRSLLNEMDIFVLPSVSEGLSLAVIEAAAAGKFIIATNVGGVPEIVDHQVNGLLFEPKNIEQLVSHLNWVIEHKQEAQKYADLLQQKVKEQFDIVKTIKQYETLYKSLV